jgi:hypothetical protein
LSVIIDREGTWLVLFADDLLSVVSADGAYLGAFDPAHGLPATPRRMVLLSDGARAIVSGAAGLALLDRS